MRQRTNAPTLSRTPLAQVVGLAVTAAVIGAVTVLSPSMHRIGEDLYPTSATTDDGALPAEVTPFEEVYPGIANIDPELLRAVRLAAKDADNERITFYVNSGWRSAAYQSRLLGEAVSLHGSAEEAARWVATPDTSAHVSGDAVDIGASDAAAWLSEHGAQYGLCQVYRNEPWHYELRPEAVGRRCPPMYPDPTHDPSLQQP